MIIKDSISQKHSIKLTDRTYLDQDGYLVCQDAIFGRTGTYQYLKKELGLVGNPNELVDLHRKAEDVFDEDSLNSLEGRPLTLQHPREKVNIDNYSKYAKGFVQNVRHNDINIIGDIRITDKKARDLVLSNKMRELSLGYDMTICQDENGDYYCKNIIYNHLALVQYGRAGNAMILDEKSEDFKEKEEEAMVEEKEKLENEDQKSEEVVDEVVEDKVEDSEEVVNEDKEEPKEEVKDSEEVVEDTKEEQPKEEQQVKDENQEKEGKQEMEVKDTNYYVSKITEIEQIKDETLRNQLLDNIKKEMGISVETKDTSPVSVSVQLNDSVEDEEDHAVKMQKYYNSFDPHLYGNDCSSKEYQAMKRQNTITKKLSDLYLESK